MFFPAPTSSPNKEAEAYFTALAALEALLAAEDTSGAPAHDPAELFSELKRVDTAVFAASLAAEIGRDATLRREVTLMRDSLGLRVKSLDRTVTTEGRDGYNDEVYGERHELTKDRERSYILARTLDRLDARLARGARLARVLDLVRIAHDVEELRSLYAAARAPAFLASMAPSP